MVNEGVNGNDPVWLFSYGTLRDPEVQLATFGRHFHGRPDQLAGYRVVMIRIDDEEFVATSGASMHRTLRFTGNEPDVVDGMALALTPEELQQADGYEPAGYDRVSVVLVSGAVAWVYLNRQSESSD